MGLGEEVVGIHGGGEHRRQRPGGLVRLDGGGQHHHVGLDLQLLSAQQIRRLDVELAVLGRDLADHALDVVDAVLLHGPAVELVEVLAGSGRRYRRHRPRYPGYFSRISMACLAVYMQQILEQ